MMELGDSGKLREGGIVRFVSDLHLGHPGGLLKTEEQFRLLVAGCSTLVVCGDYSETRPGPYREDGERMRGLFEEVCRKEGVGLVVLCGNHDPDEPEAIATYAGGKLIALHGHELFREVAPWGREYLYHKREAKREMARFPDADRDLGQCLARARALSLFVPPVVRKKERSRSGLFDLMKNACWPPTRAVRILLAWLTMGRRVDRFTERFFPDARIVCYGHLHRRVIHRRHGRLYINTGALFKNARAYAVDVQGGGLAVRDLTPSGPGAEVVRLKPGGW